MVWAAETLVGLRGCLNRGVIKGAPIAANPTYCCIRRGDAPTYKALRSPSPCNVRNRASNNPGKRLNQVWFNGEGWGSG